MVLGQPFKYKAEILSAIHYYMCLWTSNRAQDKCGTFYLTYDSKSDTGRHFGGQCQIPLAFPFFGKYKGEGVGIGIVLTRLPVEARASQACRHG